MGAAARAGCTVAFEENAQAFEREHVVNLRDIARVAADLSRQAASGDDLHFTAQFLHHALEDAVDQANVAVIQAALKVRDGVGADDLLRALDIDAAEPGGARKERIGADAEAG